MLQARGLVGRAGSTPNDATCGPHGGICQPPFPSPSPSAPAATSFSTCLVADRYADGSWALGPLVSAPAIRLAGLSVPAPLFAAVAEASPDFFEAPQGGGIMGLAMGRELGERAEDDCSTPCLTPFLDGLWAAQQQQQQQQQQQGRQERQEGQGTLSAAATPPPFPNRFSIVTATGEGEGFASALLLLGAGGGEPATAPYHDGALRYAPLQRPWGYYTVGVRGLEMPLPPSHDDDGGEGKHEHPGQGRGVVWYAEKGAGGAGAILDTGTTGILFPPAALAFFRDTLRAHVCHSAPHVCRGNDSGALSADKKGVKQQQQQQQQQRGGGGGVSRHGRRLRGRRAYKKEEGAAGMVTPLLFDSDDAVVALDASTVAQLPTLALLLHPESPGEAPLRLELGPEQYLIRDEDDDDGGEGGDDNGVAYYALAVSEWAEGEAEGRYLLGEALLGRYFVEFDREGKRAGFAPAAAWGASG